MGRIERPGGPATLAVLAGLLAGAYAGIAWLFHQSVVDGAVRGVEIAAGMYAVNWWLYRRQQRRAADARTPTPDITAPDRHPSEP